MDLPATLDVALRQIGVIPRPGPAPAPTPLRIRDDSFKAVVGEPDF